MALFNKIKELDEKGMDFMGILEEIEEDLPFWKTPDSKRHPFTPRSQKIADAMMCFLDAVYQAVYGWGVDKDFFLKGQTDDPEENWGWENPELSWAIRDNCLKRNNIARINRDDFTPDEEIFPKEAWEGIKLLAPEIHYKKKYEDMATVLRYKDGQLYTTGVITNIKDADELREKFLECENEEYFGKHEITIIK